MYTIEDQRELNELVAILDECYVESAEFTEGANLDSRAEFKALMGAVKKKNHEIKTNIKSKNYDEAHKGIAKVQELLDKGYDKIKQLEGGIGSAVLGWCFSSFAFGLRDFLLCFVPIVGQVVLIKQTIQEVAQVINNIKKDPEISADTFNAYRNALLARVRDLKKYYELLDKKVTRMEQGVTTYESGDEEDEIEEASVGTMMPITEPTGVIQKAPTPASVENEFGSLSNFLNGETEYTESVDDIAAKFSTLRFIGKEKRQASPEYNTKLREIIGYINKVEKYMIAKNADFVPYAKLKRQVKALKKDDPLVKKYFKGVDVSDPKVKLSLVSLTYKGEAAGLAAVEISPTNEYEISIDMCGKFSKYNKYYTNSLYAKYFHMVVDLDLKYWKKQAANVDKGADVKLESAYDDILLQNGIDSVIFEDAQIEERVIFEDAEDDTFTEAAKIDDDIKDVISTLNEKGYETKYSCSGHPSARLKSDIKRDGIKYGNLYSTARIVFADNYKFGSCPDGWERKELDGGKVGIYVKGPKFHIINGLPTEQFYKWKKKYMDALRSWASDLPKKGEEKKAEKDDSIEESLNELFQDLVVDLS